MFRAEIAINFRVSMRSEDGHLPLNFATNPYRINSMLQRNLHVATPAKITESNSVMAEMISIRRDLIKFTGLNSETIDYFGIALTSENRCPDSGHVIIPIHNVTGRPVGYAKYTPHNVTPVNIAKFRFSEGFRRAQEVFNINRAVQGVTSKPLVIVEGFFDVMKLHQHDCRHAVALMGNHMSAQQEESIRRVSNLHTRILLLFPENKALNAVRAKMVTRLSYFAYVRLRHFKGNEIHAKTLTRKFVTDLF